MLQNCFLNLFTLIIKSNTIIDKDLLSIFCNISKLRYLVLENVRIKKSYWRIFIDKIKSSLNLILLYINFLFNYNKNNSKIYIENKNNINNFFYLKKLYSFSNIATTFCTKNLNKIFEIFRNNLFENYN